MATPRCDEPHPFEPVRCGLMIDHAGSHWQINESDELFKWRTVAEPALTAASHSAA